MKKLICFVLSLALMLTAVSATALQKYTLVEKWQRQVAAGNGIKGTLTLNVSGETEWAKLLAPISGVPLELRAIHEGDVFQYRAYAQKGEEMLGLTQLYGDDQGIYLKSDLVPDTLLTLPTGGDVMNRLAGVQEGGTPTLYSAMMNIMNVPQTTWEGKWLPALSTYEAAIELWLENYASAPSVKRAEDGSATVLVRYDIPAEALKSEIKALWGNVLQDTALLPLLKGQLNEAQQEVFLNPHLKYHYDQVIDRLALNGNVVLEREMTAKGDPVRTEMTFPLDTQGWTALRISQLGETTTFDMQGKDQQFVLEVNQTAAAEGSAAYQGCIRMIPADKEKKAIAAAYTLVEVKSNSQDEDGRSHDITNWTVNLQPDAEFSGEGWEKVEPMEIAVRFHMHSKSLEFNPVTIDTDITVKLADAEIAVDFNLLTRSKWVMDELPTQGAVDISTMDEAARTQFFTDLGMNGLTVLMMAKQEAEPTVEPTAEPAADPTAEPVEATEAPATTEVPAEEAAQ